MKMQLNETKRIQQLAGILTEVEVKTNKATDLQFILRDLGDAYGEPIADDLTKDEFKTYTIGQVIDDWKRLKGAIKEEEVPNEVSNDPSNDTSKQVKSTMDLSKKMKALANELNSGKIKMDSVEVSAFSSLIDSVLSKVGKGSLGVAINNTNKVFVSKTKSVN